MAGVSVTYPRYFLARAATGSKFCFHGVRNVVFILNLSKQDAAPLRRFLSGILLSFIEPGMHFFSLISSVVEIDQSGCQDLYRKHSYVVLRRGSPKFSSSRTTWAFQPKFRVTASGSSCGHLGHPQLHAQVFLL